MTVKAKAIIQAFYGSVPRLSYWNGCSTGGRQGLKEAQKFPDDFLKNVLQRHQSQQFAIFVYYKSEPLTVCLELLQLRKQRRSRGNEVGRPQDCA